MRRREARGASAWLVGAWLSCASGDARADGPVRFAAESAVGWCSRSDLDVGGTGICAEPLLAGVDARVSRSHRLRLTVEGGVGGMARTESGGVYAVTSREAGGVYLAARALATWEFVPHLFFGSLGAQLRVTDSLGLAAPGVQGFGDLGGRVGRHFELGLRILAGFDGVTRLTTDGVAYADRCFALGMVVFTRWIL